MTNLNLSYSELIRLSTFEDRFNYLDLHGKVGEDTFGYDRYLNQLLYVSKEWRWLRYDIITRDNGCDLGIKDYDIGGKIFIHHINPITKDDILNDNPIVWDPNNLICCSEATHNAIHYGSIDSLPKPPVERRPGDTCPWRK